MSITKTRIPPYSALELQDMLKNGHEEADTHVFDCTLVTPMYGGGVKAGEVDTTMPIRATAIRGQLRHWWRLLNRKDAHGKVRPSKELFAAERAIWGGLGDEKTLAKSKVVVHVDAPTAGHDNLQPAATYPVRDGRLRGPEFGNLPGYVLFPAQGKSERGQVSEQPKLLLKEGMNFKLTVHLNSALTTMQREQVREALRWWATFGGIGARTRRGCGAVIVKAKEPRNPLISITPTEAASRGWSLVLGNSCGDALVAWKQVTDALKTFRQGKGIGRNKGNEANRPGRSLWPEADAVRRITKQSSSQHSKPVCDIGDRFPRAAFGLPIIFHFKDERAGDPADTTLTPVPSVPSTTAERMASPLILRPYHNDTGWYPAVLRLDTDHIDRMGLVLSGKSRESPHCIPSRSWQAEDKAGEIQPMQGRGKDAIEAFLEYFKEQSKAPANAQPSQVPQKRPTAASGVANVKLTLQKNGTLEAKHVKTNKSYYARGAAVEPLISSLPSAIQEELRNGRYVFCDIEVAGYDLIAVREKA